MHSVSAKILEVNSVARCGDCYMGSAIKAHQSSFASLSFSHSLCSFACIPAVVTHHSPWYFFVVNPHLEHTQHVVVAQLVQCLNLQHKLFGSASRSREEHLLCEISHMTPPMRINTMIIQASRPVIAIEDVRLRGHDEMEYSGVHGAYPCNRSRHDKSGTTQSREASLLPYSNCKFVHGCDAIAQLIV